MSQGPPKMKTFDCLDFERRAQAAIYEQIKDMTPAEQAAWLERAAETGPLGGWYRQLKQAQAERQAASQRNPATPTEPSPPR